MKELLINTKQLEQLLNVSTKTAIKVATDAGARVQIGRSVRWKLSIVEDYLSQLAGGNKK